MIASSVNIPRKIYQNDEAGDLYSVVYDGDGEMYFSDGSYYKGEFHNGFIHGKGVYHYPDGTSISMKFNYNKFTGSGKIKWPCGATYEG